MNSAVDIFLLFQKDLVSLHTNKINNLIIFER